MTAPAQSLLPCLDAPTCRRRTLRLTRAYLQLRVSLSARSLCPALSGVTPFGSVQGGLCEVSGEGESPPLPLQSCRLSPPSCVSLGGEESCASFCICHHSPRNYGGGVSKSQTVLKANTRPGSSPLLPLNYQYRVCLREWGEPRWVVFLSHGSGMFHLEQRQLLPALCGYARSFRD